MLEPSEQIVEVKISHLMALGNAFMRMANIIGRNRAVAIAVNVADEELNASTKGRHPLSSDMVAGLNMITDMLQRKMAEHEVTKALRNLSGERSEPGPTRT